MQGFGATGKAILAIQSQQKQTKASESKPVRGFFSEHWFALIFYLFLLRFFTEIGLFSPILFFHYLDGKRSSFSIIFDRNLYKAEGVDFS